MTMTDNKTTIQQALAGLLASGSTEGLEPLLSRDFVHHRPDKSSTKGEWLAWIQVALVPLADQQVEILQLLADGMSNADVASKLFISQETVKSHVRHILAKLEADTRTHAVAIALRQALID